MTPFCRIQCPFQFGTPGSVDDAPSCKDDSVPGAPQLPGGDLPNPLARARGGV
jgi:hypothetical protein